MLNDEQLKQAQKFWHHLVIHLFRAEPFPEIHLELVVSAERPAGGWLKHCRMALQRSPQFMAEKLLMTRQGYLKLEELESDAKISLERLKAAADVLDCEVIYFLRPKRSRSFADLIWEKILPEALPIYEQRVRRGKNMSIQQSFRLMILARIMAKLFRDPKFRRKMRWARFSSEEHSMRSNL